MKPVKAYIKYLFLSLSLLSCTNSHNEWEQATRERVRTEEYLVDLHKTSAICVKKTIDIFDGYCCTLFSYTYNETEDAFDRHDTRYICSGPDICIRAKPGMCP